MSAFKHRSLLVVAATALFAGCGSDLPLVPYSAGIQAIVNGVPWSSAYADTKVLHPSPGEFAFSAKSPGGYQLDFNLTGIRGVGTYALGTERVVGGGLVRVYDSGMVHAWETPRTGAAGTLTITGIIGNHFQGSFSFVATPNAINTTGNIAAINGTFDLPFATNQEVVLFPAASGSGIQASFGNTVFTPSRIDFQGDGKFILVANNANYQMILVLGAFTTARTYALSADSTRTLNVSRYEPPGSTLVESWYSINPGSSGSVTVTSVTPDRIAGAFTATLTRSGSSAGAPITVNGSFDLGRLAQ